jgi:hypothetical protein
MIRLSFFKEGLNRAFELSLNLFVDFVLGLLVYFTGCLPLLLLLCLTCGELLTGASSIYILRSDFTSCNYYIRFLVILLVYTLSKHVSSCFEAEDSGSSLISSSCCNSSFILLDLIHLAIGETLCNFE